MVDYGSQDTSTTNLGANQFPISESWTPNAGFSAVEGGTQTTDAGGKKSAPVRIEVKDGSDVAQGLTTDAAVVGDNPGTLSAKLRGLTKILNDVWDSVNHRLHVNVDNGNANGQAVMVNSAPVVIASDQTPVKTKNDSVETAGQAAGSVTSTSTPIIPAFDCSASKSWSFQMTGTWTMTLQVQFCDDNATWLPYFLISSSSGSIVSTITANGLYGGPVLGRYMRIIPSAFTSNASGVGTLEMSTFPFNAFSTFAIQQGVWTVQPGNTQNTTPWLMAGPNTNGTQAANSAANTVIKGSSGWLYHAIITTLGTAGLTIYDNASTNSGTPLLVIPASAAVGTIYSFPSGARAVNGITSAGVTNCPAVTFHYT